MIKTVLLAFAVLLGGFFMPAHARCVPEGYLKKHSPGHLTEFTGRGAIAYSLVTTKRAYTHLYVVENQKGIAVLPVIDGEMCLTWKITRPLHWEGLAALYKATKK